MIKCGKGTVEIDGTTLELLAQYAAITRALRDVLLEDFSKERATELLVMTANTGVSKDADKFFEKGALKNE